MALQALPSWVPLSWLRGPWQRFGGCLVWPQADASCPVLILLSQQMGLLELACPLFREALLNAQRGCGQPEGTCPAWEPLLPTSLHPWESWVLGGMKPETALWR